MPERPARPIRFWATNQILEVAYFDLLGALMNAGNDQVPNGQVDALGQRRCARNKVDPSLLHPMLERAEGHGASFRGVRRRREKQRGLLLIDPQSARSQASSCAAARRDRLMPLAPQD